MIAPLWSRSGIVSFDACAEPVLPATCMSLRRGSSPVPVSLLTTAIMKMEAWFRVTQITGGVVHYAGQAGVKGENNITIINNASRSIRCNRGTLSR